MELIGAGLADLNYNQAPGLAVFRRHAVLLDAELLDRVDGGLYVLAAKDRWRDGGAIQNIVVGARSAATDAYVAIISARTKATAAGPGPSATGLLRYAWCQRQEVVRPPAGVAECWQFLQSGRVHSLFQVALLGLQHGSIRSCDLNDLGGLPHG